MNHDRADNRPDATEPDIHETVDSIDRLDEIEVELDGLAEVDPAESVTVLSDITSKLNREIDLDMEKS
jgi:hypothetical protein